MYFRIEKDTTVYDCMCYDTKVTSPAMKLVKDSVIKYVAMGTVRNGPNMKFNDYYILLSGKQDTPTTPYISASSYGSVTISSATAGAYITYKGETKASGSTWTHDSFTEYEGYAYAYVPSDGAKLQSDNSSGLWIGMLGKPRNGGKDAHWDNYQIYNYNGVSVTFHVTGKTSNSGTDYTWETAGSDNSHLTANNWKWYFKQTSGTMAAESGGTPGSPSGDLWEGDDNTLHGDSDSLRSNMWVLKATWFYATKTNWITSAKEICKADLN
jgi:hypothetical protein